MSHTTLVFLFGIAFAWLAMLTAWVAALHEKALKHRHKPEVFR